MQADNFIWKDLSQAQLLDIRHPHPKKGLTGRDLLAKHLGIVQPEGLRNSIDLDLYVHTLQFGESQHFADDKLSGLLSIVKAVHTRSVQAKLTAERSFSLFKELLLKHSVQRPPYSIGLFSYAEMKRVMDWMLDTYYRHFKLYQYAFTDRVTMSVAQVHPLDTIELLTELQPLDIAITEEQHQEQLTEEERKREQVRTCMRYQYVPCTSAIVCTMCLSSSGHVYETLYV